MPKYIIINDESMCALILCLYEYIKLNQFQIPARYHHELLQTRTISHKKTFLSQPICQGIRFRLPCNVRQTILKTIAVKIYTAACKHAPQDNIRFSIILRFYIGRKLYLHSVTCKRNYPPRQNSHTLH